jgi:hypothetical protein
MVPNYSLWTEVNMSYPRLPTHHSRVCHASRGTTRKRLADGFPCRQEDAWCQRIEPVLHPDSGYQLVYKQGSTIDTLTVLNETVTIDGVETRVVEDREMKGSQLIELTRDYYADRFRDQRCLLFWRRC